MRLAAFTQVDITPQLGFPLAGFSLIGQPQAMGMRGRLRATVLYLRDGPEELAWVAIDALAGMAGLRSEILRALGHAKLGWREPHLVLSASHTHSAPGGMFEVPFYDRNASNSSGKNPVLAQQLGQRIAEAIVRARQEAQPAELHHRDQAVWGLHANKSLAAMDPQDKQALLARFSPPEGLDEAEQHVDPRLRVVWATAQDKFLGMIAVFGAHPCTTDPLRALMTSDAFGVAARRAQMLLSPDPENPVPIGLIVGTHGDVNLQGVGRLRDAALGEASVGDEYGEIPRSLGEALAAQLVEAISAPAPLPEGLKLRFLRVSTTARDRTAPLAQDPDVGLVSMGGSEFGRYHMNRLPMPPWWHQYRAFKLRNAKSYAREVAEGAQRTCCPWWRPLSFPKRVGVKADLVSDLFGGSPPKNLPFHEIRLGDLAILGLPFEVTTAAGQRLEHILLESGVSNAIVVSVTDAYASYLTTSHEFVAQHYEGAATLWGRNSLAWVEARVHELLTSPYDPPPMHFEPPRVLPLPMAVWCPRWIPVIRDGCRIGGFVPIEIDLHRRPFWNGPILGLYRQTEEGEWEEFHIERVHVTDARFDIEIAPEPTEPKRWRWRWLLPTPVEAPLAVRFTCKP